MYRIDNATAITPIPAPAAVGPNPNYFFTAGNPGLNIPATIVDADWLNAVQEELCNVITTAGLALSKTTRTQLISAIQLLIAGTNSTYIADTGATNTMVVTPAPAFAAYVGGMRLLVIPNHTNTGAVTINVNALGAKSAVRPDGSALLPGDIATGGVVELIYQATIGKFVLNSMITQGSVSSSGFLRIPGSNLIIQWTGYSITPSQTTNCPSGSTWGQLTVAWPITFPNGPIDAWLGPDVSNNGQYCFGMAAARTTTNCIVYINSWNTAAFPLTGLIVAIGY